MTHPQPPLILSYLQDPRYYFPLVLDFRTTVLRIRPAHLDMLESLVAQRGRASIISWLQRTYPEKFGLLTENEIAAVADAHISHALGFGFATGEQIATYLDCALRFDDDFPNGPQHSTCAQILYDLTSDPSEKLRSLEAMVFPETSEE